MIFSIFVMLAQVGLEAYILGTLFHYVVKKDAKLEEFRSATSQLVLHCDTAVHCLTVLSAQFSPKSCIQFQAWHEIRTC